MFRLSPMLSLSNISLNIASQPDIGVQRYQLTECFNLRGIVCQFAQVVYCELMTLICQILMIISNIFN